jgi:hypothetical protein
MTPSPNELPMAPGAVPFKLTPEERVRANEKIKREEHVRTIVEQALDSGAYLIATWLISPDKKLVYTPFMFNFPDGDMPTAVRQLKDELSGALRRKTEMLANRVEGSAAEVDVAREAEVAAAVAEDEGGQPNGQPDTD